MPRDKADPNLCQIIIASPIACQTCPLNVPEEQKEMSEFLQQIIELDDMIQAGFPAKLPMVEWKAIALLKRKRTEKQIKDMEKK